MHIFAVFQYGVNSFGSGGEIGIAYRPIKGYNIGILDIGKKKNSNVMPP